MRRFYAILTLLIATFSGLSSSEALIPAGEIGIGYDYFRSLPEGDWEGNTGALIDFNIGLPIPCLMNYGVGVQLGGSYGVYDWSGRGSAPSNRQNGVQQQVFLTGALFKQGLVCSPFSFGAAYDWMINKKFGVFALDPKLGQVRLQAGYLLGRADELGLWGTAYTNTSHNETQGTHVAFRAISQVNLFWRHYFENCAETMIWAGTPYRKSLMFSKERAGKFIVGASFHAPLACRFSIDGHACYMRGHSAQGARKQRTYAANIFLGVSYAFGEETCCFRPYTPIGNNSNFLVDTNLTY